MIFTIEPMINAGTRRHPRACRRLDDRHRRPLAVGAVGAHGARDARRLRGADRCRPARRRHRRCRPDARVADRRHRAALTPVDAYGRRGRRWRARARVDGRARAAVRVPATIPTRPRLLREHCAARRSRASRASGTELGAARRLALRRRRRLRARPALPAFRRRRADPAAGARSTTPGTTFVERFVGMLWDIGLEIGHSVRTIAECDAEMAADVTVQTEPPRAPAASRAARRLHARSRARVCARRSDVPFVLRGEDARAATAAPQAITTPRTTSSRTSRKARAACATCRPCCGSRARPALGRTLARACAGTASSRRQEARARRAPASGCIGGLRVRLALPRRTARGPARVRPAECARARARPARHAGASARASS